MTIIISDLSLAESLTKLNPYQSARVCGRGTYLIENFYQSGKTGQAAILVQSIDGNTGLYLHLSNP